MSSQKSQMADSEPARRQQVVQAKDASSAKDAEHGSHGDEGFIPLTREQAQELRRTVPQLSLWHVVVMQAVAACVMSGLAWLLTGRLQVVWSAVYGALAVVLPAALFARALSRQAGWGVGNAAVTRFFVWETAKIGLTLAMLLLAPRVVTNLSWLALVAGFVVTMKVYWLAMWLRLTSTSKVKEA
jgi:ATP synthase protein I